MGFCTPLKTSQLDLDGITDTMQTRQQALEGIMHTMADKTVDFGWNSTHQGRQDSRIWMGFCTSRQTRQQDLDGIPGTVQTRWQDLNGTLDPMTDKTVGFGWDYPDHGR